MEYLVSTNLNIFNKGNEPTFVISNRKEIIHLTLGSDKIVDLVTNWHVSDEISFYQTTDTKYFNYVICKLLGLNITTPGKPIQNPIRKTQRQIYGLYQELYTWSDR